MTLNARTVEHTFEFFVPYQRFREDSRLAFIADEPTKPLTENRFPER